jgi:hypothetical protein
MAMKGMANDSPEREAVVTAGLYEHNQSTHFNAQDLVDGAAQHSLEKGIAWISPTLEAIC